MRSSSAWHEACAREGGAQTRAAGTRHRRVLYFFFSSRRRHTRFDCDWSSDVCSSDLPVFERRTSEAPAPLIIASEHYLVTDWHMEPHRLAIEVADKKTDNRVRYQDRKSVV